MSPSDSWAGWDMSTSATLLATAAHAVNDLPGGPAVRQLNLHPAASKIAGGRVATVAIDSMVFLRPIKVGDIGGIGDDATDPCSSSVIHKTLPHDRPERGEGCCPQHPLPTWSIGKP